MSVPELRFKADDGSKFPGWKEILLGDAFGERSERSNGTEELLAVTIANGVTKQADSAKRNVAADDTSNYKVVYKGDLAYNTMRMWQGAEGVSDYHGIISPAYTVLICKGENSARFFAIMFKRSQMLYQFESHSQGIASDTWNLKYNIFSRIKVYAPSLSEQQKIADFFFALDLVIDQTQSEIDAWKKQKRGVMQMLFSQKVRFKADDGGEFPEWEEKTLGEVFSERIERSKGAEDLLAVTIAKGVTKQADSNKRNIAANDTSNYKVVHRGDLAYNTMRMWQGAEGASAYDGIISPAYTVLICNKGHDVTFFEYMFKQTCMLHQFEKHSQGLTSDTWNLKYKNFSPIKVFVPTLLEQQKIAACLSAFDDVIDKSEKELEAYRELKKGLLQQMFV